ncbi:serine/threonine-protein kinase M1 [Irineochytrium annulatum]|nr:serine/threonine-protein kinase M1 [Irineochytrium annulatum]
MGCPGALKDVATLMGWKVKEFVERTVEFTLPHLVIGQKKEIIQKIASTVLGCELYVLVVNELHNILAKIFMLDSSEIPPAVKFLFELLDNKVTLPALIRSDSLHLVRKVAIELGDLNDSRRQRAKNALRTIQAKINEAYDSDKDAGSLSSFLAKFFLGILSYVNADVRQQKPTSVKIKLIRSLVVLFSLIGPNILPMANQVVVTLQTVLEIPPLRSDALDAWQMFLQSLSFATIGPMLNQVILTLLRFYSEYTPIEMAKSNNPMIQDHISYAIQELLRTCGFTALKVSDYSEIGPIDNRSSAAVTTSKLWQQFSKDVISVIHPFLSSNYKASKPLIKAVDYPIYPLQHSFQKWLQTWVVDLISKAKGELAKPVFSVCRSVVDHHANFAMYLLPHLVLNILMHGDDFDRQNIIKELLSVLTSSNVIDETTELEQLSCQADDDRDSMRSRVESVLSHIPQAMMADASYRCKAYARALMHYEQHMRKERGKLSEIQMQPFYSQLQRIYFHLDEPDGMDGIATLCRNGSLEQQILEEEAAGRWTAAQTCYEMLLQRNKDNLDYHIGLINCLKNLGHLGAVD